MHYVASRLERASGVPNWPGTPEIPSEVDRATPSGGERSTPGAGDPARRGRGDGLHIPPANQPPSILVIGDWGSTLRIDLHPARNRYHLAIPESTGSGSQRTGAAPPSLIPRGITPEHAIGLAHEIGPFRRTHDILAPSGKQISPHCYAKPPGAADSTRRRVNRELPTLESALKPIQSRLEEATWTCVESAHTFYLVPGYDD